MAVIALPQLESIRIAKPCSMNWDEMTGDDRVRLCAHCNMRVYNLSGMTREGAQELVRTHEGRLCVRFYQRADGTILTRDCPVGLAAARASAARLAARVAAVVVAAVSAVSFGRIRTTDYWRRLSGADPFYSTASLLGHEPVQPRMVMGEMYVPPPRPSPKGAQ